MVERDKARGFVSEVERLWEGPLMKGVPKPARDWVRTKVMGDALDELRRLVLEGRPPVMFLIGQTGHGKSSLINALCGRTVSKVGDVRPETASSQVHHVTFDGGCAWDLIDSRGLFETNSPGGGPAEDVVELTIRDVLKHKPDVLMHVVSMPAVRALSNDLVALERIQAMAVSELGHRIPTFMVLTKPDTMDDPSDWPPEQHPEKAAMIVESIQYVADEVLAGGPHEGVSLVSDEPLYGRRLVECQQCRAVIPVRTLASKVWNMDTLHDFIGQELPEDSQLHYYQALGRKDLLRKVASRLTNKFSEIAAGVGLSPLPVADILVLSPLQLLLVVMIGGLSCRPMAKSTIKEYITAVGGTTATGFVLRAAAQQLVKLMPFGGLVVSGAIAAAGTYAIGRSAEAYFFAGEVRLPKDFPYELPNSSTLDAEAPEAEGPDSD